MIAGVTEPGAHGGVYSNGPDWQPYVVIDGKLITDQNPASSAEAARAALEQRDRERSVRSLA